MSGDLPWFRLYHRIIDDEKIRLLAFEDRWHFIAICCLKADGLLDEPHSDVKWRKIALKLGVQTRELGEIARRLNEVELVDEDMQPLAWDELQYVSDNSTARVRKYREKQRASAMKRGCNVSVTGQETDTDTDISSLRSDTRTPRDELAEVLDVERSGAVIEHRKRLRKPLTAYAARLLASKFAETGDPNAAADAMISNGWQGFKPEWMDRKGTMQPQHRNQQMIESLARIAGSEQ